MARKRQQDWEKHIAALAAGGVTVQAYAKQHKLNPATLYKWRHRLKARAAKQALTVVSKPAESRKSAKLSATPVTLLEHRNGGQCRLTLAPGVQLELSQVPSPEWLAAVTAALSRTSVSD